MTQTPLTQPTRPPASPRARAVVTDRDRAMLRDLFDSRILTAPQLAAIHFDGSREAAKKRLQTLKAARMIAARPRDHAWDPEILFLTKNGFDQLQRSGGLSDFPSINWPAMEKRIRVSPLTLKHELTVGDMKAAFHTAARSRGDTTVVEFLTWPTLARFGAARPGSTRPTEVRPDGFARLRLTTPEGELEHAFYFEVDRSTESLDRIAVRAAAYATHYRCGGFAKWMGSDGSEPAAFPFRVLWLFPSHQRLLNFAHRCVNSRPPIRRMMWLAVLNDREDFDPLAPVWTTPADCPEIDPTQPWRPSLAEQIVCLPLL